MWLKGVENRVSVRWMGVRAYHQNKKFLKNLGGVFFEALRVIEINVRKQV